MHRKKFCRANLVGLMLSVIGLVGSTHVAASSLVTQQIELRPGWNAVFLEVDPDIDSANEDDDRPATIFSLPQIEKVWSNPHPSTSAQYIQDPSEERFNEAGWRVYIPEQGAQAEESFLTNLYAVDAGQIYLVKLAGEQNQTLSITGIPSFKRIKWQPRAYNLVGFYVDPVNPASFTEMLNLSAGETTLIYALDDGASWSLLDKDLAVEPGRAYWIFNDGSINQTASIEPDLGVSRGFVFNGSLMVKQLNINLRSEVPDGNVTFTTSDAGGNPFQLQVFSGYQTDGLTPQWESLHNLQTGFDQKRYSALVGVTQRGSLSEPQESVLTITGYGTRIRLPLSAEPLSPQRGLWAGTAFVHQVSHVNAADPTALESTTSPMPVSLLLHVDQNDQVRLLKQAYLMNDEAGLATEAGDTVVVASDAQLASYQPTALSRREGMGLRFSSSVFDFPGTSLLLSGDVYSSVSGTIELDPQQLPSHPLKHRYHTAHDDLSASGQAAEPIIDSDGTLSTFYDEVWTITRHITLQMDENIQPDPDSGLGQINGVYRETVEGLHKRDIHVEGRFMLRRINMADTLVE